MKKPGLLFLPVMFVFFYFFVGCASSGNGKEAFIRFENNTGKEIILLSFSGKIINETPIVLLPHSQSDLYINSNGSGIDIIFSYNEGKYTINTGYADDYWSYTLRFSETDTSIHGIECFFVTKGFTGTDKNPREIIKISDD